MFEMGLNCVKLLSPNKPDTEPTPYAAYLAPSRHAIRSHVAGGIISTIAVLCRATERANAVARLGHFFGSFGANVMRAAGRHRPPRQGSGRSGHCLPGEASSESPHHTRPYLSAARR